MEIIRPGHYRNKFTSNSETQDIIRVLGESDIPGTWILFEKLNETTHKTISEYELQNSWELLNTSITEESTAPKKHLLAGLDFIDETEEIVSHGQQSHTLTEEQIPAYSANLTTNIVNEIKPVVQLHPDDIFILSILEKISISKNNERFDTNDKPDIIKVEIEIPIDYNFDKLKETVNLLDLNKYLVANLLISNNDFKDLIQDKLKSKILEKFNDNIVTPEIPKQVELPIIVNKTEIINQGNLEKETKSETIETILSENDERLIAFQDKMKNLYSNKNN